MAQHVLIVAKNQFHLQGSLIRKGHVVARCENFGEVIRTAREHQEHFSQSFHFVAINKDINDDARRVLLLFRKEFPETEILFWDEVSKRVELKEIEKTLAGFKVIIFEPNIQFKAFLKNALKEMGILEENIFSETVFSEVFDLAIVSGFALEAPSLFLDISFLRIRNPQIKIIEIAEERGKPSKFNFDFEENQITTFFKGRGFFNGESLKNVIANPRFLRIGIGRAI